ncbi:MAG TPA: hypothetical protein DCM60_06250 [Nitrospina sp.]|jgi:hypothetical protein|nr:hypothetical protein [Nitrospina sp.]|tara:strand:+ start:837 stop:1025 length:189 start_codon:yes stop_codon:yes gene_type:complete
MLAGIIKILSPKGRQLKPGPRYQIKQRGTEANRFQTLLGFGRYLLYLHFPGNHATFHSAYFS